MHKTFMATAMALGLLAAVPHAAQAQTFITPFAGATFGADAPATKFSSGVAVTFMGKAAGFEAELGYTPDFFDKNNSVVLIGSNNVTSFMGNLLVGVGDGPVRPYGTVGFGLLRSSVTSASALFNDVTSNDWGFNAGFGVIVMVSDHVGVRGDGRYFRNLRDTDPGGGLDLTTGSFDFWRAYGGLSFKF